MKIHEIVTEAVVDPAVAAQYTIPVEMQQMVAILEEHCSDAWNAFVQSRGQRGIFKGGKMPGNKMYYAIDSSKIERRSQNTANFYTLFLSVFSDKWKAFPPRDRSLICSTDRGYASDYGDLYAVFPANGTKIGMCSEDDFWYSFPESGFFSMEDFSRQMSNAATHWSKGKYVETLSASHEGNMQILAKFLDQTVRAAGVAELFKVASNVKVKDAIEHALDPNRNGFHMITPAQLSTTNDKVECWFSGKCIMADMGKLLYVVLPELEKNKSQKKEP